MEMKVLFFLGFFYSLVCAFAWGQPPPDRFYSLIPEWNVTINVTDLIVWVENDDLIAGVLRFVPAGTFIQGSPIEEPCRSAANEVQFTHTLSRSILVMETEVTQQMWADLKGLQPSLPTDPSDLSVSSGMNHPVQRVTWFEAVLFSNLLSVERDLTPTYYKDASFTITLDDSNYLSGEFYCNFDADGYRLPTEGEWEHFARGGTEGPFSIFEPNYDGDSCSSCTNGLMPDLESVSVFCANETGGTAPAGSKNANPFGLKDVHGNVWERCWDWHGAYPSSPASDFTGAESGSVRVERGGGWYLYSSLTLRSASRSGNSPGVRANFFGFRLVRTIPNE